MAKSSETKKWHRQTKASSEDRSKLLMVKPRTGIFYCLWKKKSQHTFCPINGVGKSVLQSFLPKIEINRNNRQSLTGKPGLLSDKIHKILHLKKFFCNICFVTHYFTLSIIDGSVLSLNTNSRVSKSRSLLL